MAKGSGDEVYIAWLIRFKGTLTQGPNAGVTYTKATSWGGCLYPTSEKALEQMVKYREREPGLTYFLVERWTTRGTKPKMTEITHVTFTPNDEEPTNE